MQLNRLGILVASANTTIEREFQMLAAEGTSIHSTRIPHRKLSRETVAKMREDALSAAELLAHAQVDCIVYGITAGSFLLGPDHDSALIDQIESSTGIRTITVLQAVMHKLHELNVRAFALATPYPDEVTRQETDFFTEAGYRVTGAAGLGHRDVADIGNLAPSTAARVVDAAVGPDAEGVFLSCTNWHTLPLLEDLQKRLNIPTFSSNSAAFHLATQLGDL